MISYGIVGENIKELVMKLNTMFSWLMEMLQNPAVLGDMINNVNPDLVSAVNAMAITLCTLFFLIDFFTKTLHLQWVTWENVLLLFVKLFVAKFFVDNSKDVLNMISNAFTSLSSTVPSFTHLIPTGENAYPYFLAGSDLSYVQNQTQAGFLDFAPLLLNLKVTIQGFIMQIIIIISTIIVIGRMFELTVYTSIAPIPLSTLACDGLQDIGKGFIKSYSAVCLQAVVLVLMFYAYQAMDGNVFSSAMTQMPAVASWLGMIKTFVLGAAVMQ